MVLSAAHMCRLLYNTALTTLRQPLRLVVCVIRGWKTEGGVDLEAAQVVGPDGGAPRISQVLAQTLERGGASGEGLRNQ